MEKAIDTKKIETAKNVEIFGRQERLEKYSRFGNVVSEESGNYTTKSEKKKEKDKCFLSEELTAVEMVAIGNYQDVHPWNDQKQEWSFEVPEYWRAKSYCYVVNSCCRSRLFYEMMTKEERELIDFNLLNLDNAIEKGRIWKELFIYRGVKNTNWLPKNHTVNTEFFEDAYGSFSLNLDIALQYTNKKNPIIFRLLVTPEMRALRIDDSEFEMLRPRKIRYTIVNISKRLIRSSEDEFIEVTFYDIKEI